MVYMQNNCQGQLLQPLEGPTGEGNDLIFFAVYFQTLLFLRILFSNLGQVNMTIYLIFILNCAR